MNALRSMSIEVYIYSVLHTAFDLLLTTTWVLFLKRFLDCMYPQAASLAQML